NISRFLRFVIFILIFVSLFVGGSAALFYLIFSNYTGIQNIWLLVCGAPFVLVVLLIFLLFNLYMRYGKPLEQLFNAINEVEAGNLAIRVPEVKSDMFSDLVIRFNKMVGELERAEQQRRNLTADIAHELRTPLHIIQGNLEGIVDGVYEPTPEHINNTLDETKLLARLVNDLQTLSLAETGQLPLHPTRFLLADLIQDLTSSFASQAASQGINLQTSIAKPNQELTADYDRLNQVLSNLFSNALRHTPEGGTISIKTESASSPERSVRITVKDTGSGITSEDLPFIFDRFWRGDKSRSERMHSGLGLAITKQLVHAHGGTIDVQSELGKGTTFIIELPNRM
ncbi:MAG TPA: ATP-binding protein, partial [Anaerolineales bacterium]|nr:ATP-binding protein [Anaerolineales bacterium]